MREKNDRISGCVCCITIIGIPVGLQCFKFAKLALCPFGRIIYYGNMSSGSVLLNVLWILLCGIELAVASAMMGIICCLTIIGIPFGLQHFKFAALALMRGDTGRRWQVMERSRKNFLKKVILSLC